MISTSVAVPLDTVSVPWRATVTGLASTENVKEPSPVPLAALSVIHATSLDADHPHSGLATPTATVTGEAVPSESKLVEPATADSESQAGAA